MSDFYSKHQRELQERFSTRPLADRLREVTVHDTFTADDTAFIGARDFFFLATTDPDGHPTVSYKGGVPGFVEIADNLLSFPCYDGNGMFLSMGNIQSTAKVGLLFIDFVVPKRLRVQGTARLQDSSIPGVIARIEVEPQSIFVNCPRYIHRYKKIADAPHVPRSDGSAPIAQWKRWDAVYDSLPDKDKMAVDAAGTLGLEEAIAKFNRGEG